MPTEREVAEALDAELLRHAVDDATALGAVASFAALVVVRRALREPDRHERLAVLARLERAFLSALAAHLAAATVRLRTQAAAPDN